MQSKRKIVIFYLESLIVIFLLAIFAIFLFISPQYRWKVVWEYRFLFVKGWLTTIWISFVSFWLSALIGIIFALMKRSKHGFFHSISSIYIELIRGTPLLVQLLFFFYVIANAVHIENRYLVGILCLSFFTGAYIAEIIRSGIEGVGQSQIQSALSLGFSNKQIYRYVIFPQAFRKVLPPLAGQFASLIKDSSLLSILGISEFTYSAEQINSTTFSTLESFFPLAIGYLILTYSISIWSKHLERKYYYET